MQITVPVYYEQKDGSFIHFDLLSEEKKKRVIEKATKQALRKKAREEKTFSHSLNRKEPD